MPVFQLDYFVGKNKIQQIVKYYHGMQHPYRIFTYINRFNAGFAKQKETLEECIWITFSTINDAHTLS